MNQEYLRTDRVVLRQYRADDFEKLLELNSDPEVMKYLSNGVPGTREETQEGVDRTLLYQTKFSGNLGVYTAELVENSEYMGWFHLRPAKTDLENTKDLELGYRLKKKFWGTGFASEVSKALIEKAFKDLSAESVFAQTLKNNLASRRVMQKLGMKFEQEFTDHEHLRQGPAVMYRIHKSPKT